MNYISEVAKMLGVELGEEFELNENENWICIFTEDQFEVSNKNKVYVNASLGEHVLAELIGGAYTVKRKPWKPQQRYEVYYLVHSDGDVVEGCWTDREWDKTNYKIGNCYRTKEEAEANSAKWIAFYKSDEVLEV